MYQVLSEIPDLNNDVVNNNQTEWTKAGLRGGLADRSEGRDLTTVYNHGEATVDGVFAGKGTKQSLPQQSESRFSHIKDGLESSVSAEGKERIDRIVSDVNSLSDVEKLLLYLKLPTGATSEDQTRQTPTSFLHSSNRIEQAQAFTWIRSHLEEDAEICVPKHEVFDDYRLYCESHTLKPLCPADFGKVMKCVFPNVKPRRLGQRGQSKYCYSGLRKKLEVQPPSLPELEVSPKRENIEYSEENELNMASRQLVCEWAQKLLGRSFNQLQEVAEFLVGNLYVNSKSTAAFTVLAAMQETGLQKSNVPVSSLFTSSSGGNKHKEMQIQLQRKLAERELIKEQKKKLQQHRSEVENENEKLRAEGFLTPSPAFPSPVKYAARNITKLLQSPVSHSESRKVQESPKLLKSPMCFLNTSEAQTVVNQSVSGDRVKKVTESPVLFTNSQRTNVSSSMVYRNSDKEVGIVQTSDGSRSGEGAVISVPSSTASNTANIASVPHHPSQTGSHFSQTGLLQVSDDSVSHSVVKRILLQNVKPNFDKTGFSESGSNKKQCEANTLQETDSQNAGMRSENFHIVRKPAVISSGQTFTHNESHVAQNGNVQDGKRKAVHTNVLNVKLLESNTVHNRDSIDVSPVTENSQAPPTCGTLPSAFCSAFVPVTNSRKDLNSDVSPQLNQRISVSTEESDGDGNQMQIDFNDSCLESGTSSPGEDDQKVGHTAVTSGSDGPVLSSPQASKRARSRFAPIRPKVSPIKTIGSILRETKGVENQGPAYDSRPVSAILKERRAKEAQGLLAQIASTVQAGRTGTPPKGNVGKSQVQIEGVNLPVNPSKALSTIPSDVIKLPITPNSGNTPSEVFLIVNSPKPGGVQTELVSTATIASNALTNPGYVQQQLVSATSIPSISQTNNSVQQLMSAATIASIAQTNSSVQHHMSAATMTSTAQTNSSVQHHMSAATMTSIAQTNPCVQHHATIPSIAQTNPSTVHQPMSASSITSNVQKQTILASKLVSSSSMNAHLDHQKDHQQTISISGTNSMLATAISSSQFESKSVPRGSLIPVNLEPSRTMSGSIIFTSASSQKDMHACLGSSSTTSAVLTSAVSHSIQKEARSNIHSATAASVADTSAPAAVFVSSSPMQRLPQSGITSLKTSSSSSVTFTSAPTVSDLMNCPSIPMTNIVSCSVDNSNFTDSRYLLDGERSIKRSPRQDMMEVDLKKQFSIVMDSDFPVGIDLQSTIGQKRKFSDYDTDNQSWKKLNSSGVVLLEDDDVFLFPFESLPCSSEERLLSCGADIFIPNDASYDGSKKLNPTSTAAQQLKSLGGSVQRQANEKQQASNTVKPTGKLSAGEAFSTGAAFLGSSGVGSVGGSGSVGASSIEGSGSVGGTGSIGAGSIGDAGSVGAGSIGGTGSVGGTGSGAGSIGGARSVGGTGSVGAGNKKRTVNLGNVVGQSVKISGGKLSLESLESDALLDTSPMSVDQDLVTSVGSKSSPQTASIGVNAKSLRPTQKQLIHQKMLLDEQMNSFLNKVKNPRVVSEMKPFDKAKARHILQKILQHTQIGRSLNQQAGGSSSQPVNLLSLLQKPVTGRIVPHKEQPVDVSQTNKDQNQNCSGMQMVEDSHQNSFFLDHLKTDTVRTHEAHHLKADTVKSHEAHHLKADTVKTHEAHHLKADTVKSHEAHHLKTDTVKTHEARRESILKADTVKSREAQRESILNSELPSEVADFITEHSQDPVFEQNVSLADVDSGEFHPLQMTDLSSEERHLTEPFTIPNTPPIRTKHSDVNTMKNRLVPIQRSMSMPLFVSQPIAGQSKDVQNNEDSSNTPAVLTRQAVRTQRHVSADKVSETYSDAGYQSIVRTQRHVSADKVSETYSDAGYQSIVRTQRQVSADKVSETHSDAGYQSIVRTQRQVSADKVSETYSDAGYHSFDTSPGMSLTVVGMEDGQTGSYILRTDSGFVNEQVVMPSPVHLTSPQSASMRSTPSSVMSPTMMSHTSQSPLGNVGSPNAFMPIQGGMVSSSNTNKTHRVALIKPTVTVACSSPSGQSTESVSLSSQSGNVSGYCTADGGHREDGCRTSCSEAPVKRMGVLQQLLGRKDSLPSYEEALHQLNKTHDGQVVNTIIKSETDSSCRHGMSLSSDVKSVYSSNSFSQSSLLTPPVSPSARASQFPPATLKSHRSDVSEITYQPVSSASSVKPKSASQNPSVFASPSLYTSTVPPASPRGVVMISRTLSMPTSSSVHQSTASPHGPHSVPQSSAPPASPRGPHSVPQYSAPPASPRGPHSVPPPASPHGPLSVPPASPHGPLSVPPASPHGPQSVPPVSPHGPHSVPPPSPNSMMLSPNPHPHILPTASPTSSYGSRPSSRQSQVYISGRSSTIPPSSPCGSQPVASPGSQSGSMQPVSPREATPSAILSYGSQPSLKQTPGREAKGLRSRPAEPGSTCDMSKTPVSSGDPIMTKEFPFSYHLALLREKVLADPDMKPDQQKTSRKSVVKSEVMDTNPKVKRKQSVAVPMDESSNLIMSHTKLSDVSFVFSNKETDMELTSDGASVKQLLSSDHVSIQSLNPCNPLTIATSQNQPIRTYSERTNPIGSAPLLAGLLNSSSDEENDKLKLLTTKSSSKSEVPSSLLNALGNSRQLKNSEAWKSVSKKSSDTVASVPGVPMELLNACGNNRQNKVSPLHIQIPDSGHQKGISDSGHQRLLKGISDSEQRLLKGISDSEQRLLKGIPPDVKSGKNTKSSFIAFDLPNVNYVGRAPNIDLASILPHKPAGRKPNPNPSNIDFSSIFPSNSVPTSHQVFNSVAQSKSSLPFIGSQCEINPPNVNLSVLLSDENSKIAFSNADLRSLLAGQNSQKLKPFLNQNTPSNQTVTVDSIPSSNPITSTLAGQNSLQLGQNNLQLGQNNLQLGQNNLQLGQNNLQLGQNSVQLGQNSLQLGQNNLQLGQNNLQLGQNNLQLGQNSVSVQSKERVSSGTGNKNNLCAPLKARNSSMEKSNVGHSRHKSSESLNCENPLLSNLLSKQTSGVQSSYFRHFTSEPDVQLVSEVEAESQSIDDELGCTLDILKKLDGQYFDLELDNMQATLPGQNIITDNQTVLIDDSS